jgi:hypothetical protein
MPPWSPAAWGEFTPSGIVLFMVVFFIVALLRGWLVIGRYHNEVVARSDKDQATIRILSEAVTERTAEDNATTKILAAFREAASGGER